MKLSGTKIGRMRYDFENHTTEMIPTGTISPKDMVLIENSVGVYPDFPSPGISFKDLSPLYTSPEIMEIICNYFEDVLEDRNPDCVIGCDARGFILGSYISKTMGIPLVLARKPGKLPGELLTKKYDLEYGSAELQIQKDIISKYKSPVIADDVLATGGTVRAITEMLNSIGIEVNSYAFISEIEALNGRASLGSDVFSILKS
jgi:adenine phosphoribosyltransferase